MAVFNEIIPSRCRVRLRKLSVSAETNWAQAILSCTAGVHSAKRDKSQTRQMLNVRTQRSKEASPKFCFRQAKFKYLNWAENLSSKLNSNLAVSSAYVSDSPCFVKNRTRLSPQTRSKSTIRAASHHMLELAMKLNCVKNSCKGNAPVINIRFQFIL